MSKTNAADTLSFEEALQSLEQIVKSLESGEGDLEKAITDFERGTALKNQCMQKLDAARLKVEKIMQSASGELTTAPLDE